MTACREIAERLEALPTPSRPIHRPRSSSREGDPGGRELFARVPEYVARGPLPRVLTGMRVLVVDADPDSAGLFAAALAACGADVVTASGAREALRLLAGDAVDVVVSDIAMPDADGYWLVREIRVLGDPQMRSVPVLAVTAFGREHVRARALAAGFVDHLEKPIDPEHLCRAVARVRRQ